MTDQADAVAASSGPMVIRKRRRRNRSRSPLETRLPWVIAAIAAITAVFSGAEPTGLIVFDSILTAAFAVAVTLASSQAKRWTLVWMVGIATASAIGSWWVIPGAVAFVPLGILISGRARNNLLGAVVGALAVQALLNIPSTGFSGMPSLIAAVAVLPVLWSAYTKMSARQSRQVRNTVLIVVGAATIAVAGFGIASLSARSKVGDAVANSEKALKALRAGDQEAAGELFEQAAREFSDARSTLRAPWALPARLVPIAGQNAESLVVAASSGQSLSTTAAEAATAAPYQQLRSSGGQIDLARVETMQAPVDASLQTLLTTHERLSKIDTPWLISPVRNRIDRFTQVVDDAIPQADLASATLRVLPDLLGAGTTKRYFIAFTTPSETRFQGGFMGAYGELEARDGRLTLTRSGPIDDLNRAPGTGERKLNGMRVYQERYGRFNPELFFQNLTASPDLPTNAAAIADLYPQSGGEHIDGVVYIDPYGLAALLQLTGPVEVEGLDFKLDSENAAKYLLEDQYLQGKTTEARQDALVSAAHATFTALTSRDLPSPSKITEALGDAVRGGRIAFTTFDDETNAYLERLGLTGAFLDTSSGDFLDIRVANAGGNKIDAFLSRVIDYRVTFDARTGSVVAVATIELKNAAPATGISDYVIGNLYGQPPGTNRLWLAVFTPLTLDHAERDGSRVPTESQQELGAHVYSTLETIPPGETTRIEFTLHGSWPGTDTYRLTLGHQPLIHDDQVSVTVRPADGAPRIIAAQGMEQDGSRVTWSDTLTEPMHFEVDFDN